ncbi:hypothetical protein evm_003178 [Chilo suppressalis]|nr:hypothetical protein evm_003178 [Chilo suppressalis]
MKEKVTFCAFVTQSLAAIIIAFLTSLTGFVYGWPSYTLANFVSNETLLSHPMSKLEVSLLGSLTNLGALVVTPFIGYILDSIGRKYSAMLFGLPSVIAWSVLCITNYVPLILLAVGFAGVGAAGQAVSSVYISEICQNSIRGALTSTTVSGYFLGLLFTYTIGGRLTYHQVIYVHLSLSILYVLLLAVLQDSPVYLMQKGREQEAARAVTFYRRVPVRSKEVEVVIANIKLQLDPQSANTLLAHEDSSKHLIKAKLKENLKEQSAWAYLKKSESSKRALATVIIVMVTTICMGSIALQVYAEPLFKEAVPSMDPNQCSIYLAIVYVVASLVCSVLLDRLGRKFLLTTTSVGSGILTLLLGTQLRYHWAPHWVTATFIYVFGFVYNLGAAVVPFVLTAEVFLPEVRGLGNSITMAFMWIMNFATLIVFHPIVNIIGLGFTFCLFSVVCFFGAIYSQFCLPETKGLSADEIQLLFQKRPNQVRNNKV